MKLEVEKKLKQVLIEPHDCEETWNKLDDIGHETLLFLAYNKDGVAKGLVTPIEYQIMWVRQELANMRERGIPYFELKDLCAECLDVCQIILERQITDRESLPEFKAFETKLYERKRELTSRPEYAHLYREFPGS